VQALMSGDASLECFIEMGHGSADAACRVPRSNRGPCSCRFGRQPRGRTNHHGRRGCDQHRR
jgi:hypothetical protein